MAINFQIIENAPLPVKAVKEKRASRRQKYGFDQIPVGGAARYEGEGVNRKAIYAAAYQYSKKHAGWKFQIVVGEGNDAGAIFVHRIADEGNGGAHTASSETVTNGDYDYSMAAAE